MSADGWAYTIAVVRPVGISTDEQLTSPVFAVDFPFARSCQMERGLTDTSSRANVTRLVRVFDLTLAFWPSGCLTRQGTTTVTVAVVSSAASHRWLFLLTLSIHFSTNNYLGALIIVDVSWTTGENPSRVVSLRGIYGIWCMIHLTRWNLQKSNCLLMVLTEIKLQCPIIEPPVPDWKISQIWFLNLKHMPSQDQRTITDVWWRLTSAIGQLREILKKLVQRYHRL